MNQPQICETKDGPVYVLDRAAIEAILHHTHWIAWKKDEHDAFCRGNYPGYSIGELVQILQDRKALAKSRDHFSGYRPRVHLPEVRIPVQDVPSPNGGTRLRSPTSMAFNVGHSAT